MARIYAFVTPAKAGATNDECAQGTLLARIYAFVTPAKAGAQY